MFMLTLGRSALRRAGLGVFCMLCIVGAAAGASHFSAVSVAADAAVGESPVNSTQEISAFFTGFGLETDLTTAAVDEVKIPRRWDADFKAFNEAVEQSGLSLTGVKGKRVQKWSMLCPALSDGEKTVRCVLLVHQNKPVGAYLLTTPGGEVTGLSAARQTMADLSAEHLPDATAASASAAAEESGVQEVSAEAEDWPIE